MTSLPLSARVCGTARHGTARHGTARLADSGDSGRVLGIGFHPFLVGHPWRAIHLARALEQLRDREGVWLSTSDEVANWFYRTDGGAAQ